jgi:hypothetical protein
VRDDAGQITHDGVWLDRFEDVATAIGAAIDVTHADYRQ